MATFSWSDTARAAFGSCLPCLQSSERHDVDNGDDRQHPARGDELESLLQGAEFSDAEMDTDALSLHSRLGQQDGRKRIKKKRGRKKGSITLFGFDLFGRPLSGLPSEDIVSDREHDANKRISRISSSTLDSDAAPLADDAIAELSTQTRALWEADETREARNARKRMRKMARLLSERDHDFQGFPGTGPTQDEFGAFQEAQPVGAGSEFVQVEAGGADEIYGDADADFDATSYVRTAAPRSDSGSGSRSHTSGSASNVPNAINPILAHRIPLPASSHGSVSSPPPTPKPKSKRSKKSGKRSATTTSSSASQPRSPTESVHVPRVAVASPTFEGFPDDDEAFAGHPQDKVMRRPFSLKLTGESVHGESEGNASSPKGFPSPGLSKAGFPSPGLGGRRMTMSGKGVYLARTGEDA